MRFLKEDTLKNNEPKIYLGENSTSIKIYNYYEFIEKEDDLDKEKICVLVMPS